MIRIRAWKDAETAPQIMEAQQFDPDTTGDWRVLWIDLDDDAPEVHRKFMQEILGLPRLALDDALRERHPPKYEELEDDWNFLLMRDFDIDSANVKRGTMQLPVFWRGNLLVTRHDKPCASIGEILQTQSSGELRAPRNGGDLLYALLSKLLDRYLPILLQIEARLEEIEDQLLERPDDSLLGELMEFSSQLKRLRRIGAYHEKCFTSLRTHGAARQGIKSAQLTDLYEHAERLHSLSSLLYEIASDLINGYLSVSSHRLNNVMRVLTVVTVLFVPLTFLAGIYGMNFEFMPELHWHAGYFIVLGIMGTVALGLLIVFRRKGWI